mmetsp:Transcript_11289/g.34015  ORF Transcript_11289/g.34015 Transcript_11289/m.34015 type:complete len:218 (-) Transcript_11289:1129-1782(-)
MASRSRVTAAPSCWCWGTWSPKNFSSARQSVSAATMALSQRSIRSLSRRSKYLKSPSGPSSSSLLSSVSLLEWPSPSSAAVLLSPSAARSSAVASPVCGPAARPPTLPSSLLGSAASSGAGSASKAPALGLLCSFSNHARSSTYESHEKCHVEPLRESSISKPKCTSADRRLSCVVATACSPRTTAPSNFHTRSEGVPSRPSRGRLKPWSSSPMTQQ